MTAYWECLEERWGDMIVSPYFPPIFATNSTLCFFLSLAFLMPVAKLYPQLQKGWGSGHLWLSLSTGSCSGGSRHTGFLRYCSSLKETLTTWELSHPYTYIFSGFVLNEFSTLLPLFNCSRMNATSSSCKEKSRVINNRMVSFPSDCLFINIVTLF